MANQAASLETIEDFLGQKRIAIVGISRNPKDFSVMVFEEFTRRGYDVVPVNPGASEVLGRRCYARVQDVQPAAEAALLMTSPDVTDTVVHDCAGEKVKHGGRAGHVVGHMVLRQPSHTVQTWESSMQAEALKWRSRPLVKLCRNTRRFTFQAPSR